MGPREQRLKQILSQLFRPLYLEVENESHNHSVPENSETHFKILVVSEDFEGLSRIDRQRRVNELLKAELQSGLHAITQRLLSPEEWEKQKASLDFVSPNCHGGGKR
jgi:BolA protein